MMKYLPTFSFMCFTLTAYSSATSGDLGVHILGTNSMQSADRARALIKSGVQSTENTALLDMVETESIGGVGAKASDTTYNASGASARIDKYVGSSSVIGASVGGIYTEVAGNTVQSEDVTVMTNLYGATKSNSLPIGAFFDLGYANFLGDNTAFGKTAMSALAGLSLNLETDTEGLTYTPMFMLNSLYLQDGTNSDDATYNGLRMMLGVELDYAISKNYSATLKGLYSYEFMDTSGAYNYNSFTGTYSSLGNLGNESLQFGAGLNYNLSDVMSAGLDYSVHFYNNFISNNISFKLGLSF